MNILVTGAFGWTAQPLIEKLAESGHSVIALDLPSAERPQGTRLRAGKIVLGDVSSYEDVHQATSSAEAIMHLAVATGPNHYETPDTPFAVNVKGTYNVFASARTRGGWVCRYDLADACLKALELRPEGYAVYHVVGSRLASDRFDIARTEREFGDVISVAV
jgi:dTDP-4-dehydrorhamnose reductase